MIVLHQLASIKKKTDFWASLTGYIPNTQQIRFRGKIRLVGFRSIAPHFTSSLLQPTTTTNQSADTEVLPTPVNTEIPKQSATEATGVNEALAHIQQAKLLSICCKC